MPEYVWLTEERHYAELVNYGAHFSLVRYTRYGYDFEVLVSNDELNFIEADNDED